MLPLVSVLKSSAIHLGALCALLMFRLEELFDHPLPELMSHVRALLC